MNYDEAIKLLQETSSGSMQVTEDLRIGDWQGASHLFTSINYLIKNGNNESLN